jgi:hypothetical protein
MALLTLLKSWCISVCDFDGVLDNVMNLYHSVRYCNTSVQKYDFFVVIDGILSK